METYHITPAILNEHIILIQFNPKKDNLMSEISTQTKTKLTKLYNKRHE